jgi:hypothetical protein
MARRSAKHPATLLALLVAFAIPVGAIVATELGALDHSTPAHHVLGDVDELREELGREGVKEVDLRGLRGYLVGFDPKGPFKPQVETVPGLLLLSGRSPHLNHSERSFCETSRWFEFSAHGERFNRLGEYQFGPSRGGMDRFALHEEHGKLIADLTLLVPGPPRTVQTYRQPPAGPYCVG